MLKFTIAEIRKELTKFLNYQYDRMKIADSMPIPV